MRKNDNFKIFRLQGNIDQEQKRTESSVNFALQHFILIRALKLEQKRQDREEKLAQFSARCCALSRNQRNVSMNIAKIGFARLKARFT